MRRLWFVLAVVGCDSGSSMMMPPFHRDGGLMFDPGDLADNNPVPDLAGGRDLAGPVVSTDMATSGNCAAALASLSWDFEAGTNGFTHQAIDGYAGDPSWPFDEWARGTPSGAGPGACHGGTQCFGTRLNGNYCNCQRAQLVTPKVDLSACAGTNIKLVFWHWYDFWTGSYAASTWYDGGLVDFSGDDGGSWSPSGFTYPGTIRINPDQGFGYECLSPNSFEVDGEGGFVQSSGAWVMVELPIPAAMRTTGFRARFAYSTGVSYQTTDIATSRSHANPGWYVDDVSILTQ